MDGVEVVLEVIRLGVLGGAVFFAWRIVSSAMTTANERYKVSAKEADDARKVAEERYKAKIEQLETRIDGLEADQDEHVRLLTAHREALAEARRLVMLLNGAVQPAAREQILTALIVDTDAA